MPSCAKAEERIFTMRDTVKTAISRRLSSVRCKANTGKRINISASPEPSIWKFVLQSSSFATAVVGASLANVHFSGGREILITHSPVAVYRTEPDGKTTFFAPDQPEFVPYLIANYENKYRAIIGGEPEHVTIQPLEPQRRIVTRFKEKWITCYKGKYALTGSSKALEFIYNTGLGVKNSAGFGMLVMRKSGQIS